MNTTRNRKAREVADREQMLLDVALEIIEEQGISNLTMDKLTVRSEYSKGTVYNHFSSKEDLLTGLCTRSMRIQYNLYQKLVDFNGSTREIMLGFAYAYELFARLYPELYMIALTVKTPSVTEKISYSRSESMEQAENGLVQLLTELVNKAIDAGELDNKYLENIYQVTFAIWSMAFGTVSLMSTLGKSGQSACMNNICTESTLRYNASIMLDGLNWLPLSADHDYEKTWLRFKQEVFIDEQEILQQQNTLAQTEQVEEKECWVKSALNSLKKR